MYFYIWDGLGIREPWDSDKVYVIASGDDTVVWVTPELADELKVAILARTTRDKKP